MRIIAGVAKLQSDAPQSTYRRRLPGLMLVFTGVLLVAAASAYYLFGWVETRRLDSLAYAPETSMLAPPPASAMTLEGIPQKAPGASSAERSASPQPFRPDPQSQRLYPGERIAFNYWAEPWAAEPPATTDETQVQGFMPVGKGFLLGKRGALTPAGSISIPAIELKAEVQDLKILDLGDYRQYETPNRVVGHIPDTANPGEVGNGWLFGHLESPIRNEGSVFKDLPRIPEILRTGQRVYVILESAAGRYLYEVYKTDVVYKDDLSLYDQKDSTITLVTCVPAILYDHRLLVSARLVGFKPAE